MKTFFKIAAASCLTFAAAPGAMASTILIDDFSAQQKVESVAGLNPSSSTLLTPTVIGGSRFLSVVTSPQNATNTAPVAGTTLEATGTQGLPSDNTLQFANSTNQTGVATIRYDDNGLGLDDGIGDPGFDLTKGGILDKFFFEILTFDLLGTVFTATVEDADGIVRTYTENLAPTLSPFLAFSDPDFAGVDFTKVTSLAFGFDSSAVPNFDGALGSISVVPLPASALLLIGGLGGLFGVSAVGRRRRREEA